MFNKIIITSLTLLLLIFISKSVYLLREADNNDNQNELLDDAALKGRQVFLEKNCIACHQIYGLGGYMGPDLTNVISAPGKGRNFARAILMTGTAKMPNLHLSTAEIDDVLNYLEKLDKTGESPLKNYKISTYGNIEIEKSTRRN